MTQFMRTIPRELDDAARIDGAAHLVACLYRIIIPLCRPALTVRCCLHFSVDGVNNFLEPIIYLRDFESLPISVGLAFFQVALRHRMAFVYGGDARLHPPDPGRLFLRPAASHRQGWHRSRIKG